MSNGEIEALGLSREPRRNHGDIGRIARVSCGGFGRFEGGVEARIAEQGLRQGEVDTRVAGSGKERPFQYDAGAVAAISCRLVQGRFCPR